MVLEHWIRHGPWAWALQKRAPTGRNKWVDKPGLVSLRSSFRQCVPSQACRGDESFWNLRMVSGVGWVGGWSTTLRAASASCFIILNTTGCGLKTKRKDLLGEVFFEISVWVFLLRAAEASSWIEFLSLLACGSFLFLCNGEIKHQVAL